MLHKWNLRRIPLYMAPQMTTTGEYWMKVCTEWYSWCIEPSRGELMHTPYPRWVDPPTPSELNGGLYMEWEVREVFGWGPTHVFFSLEYDSGNAKASAQVYTLPTNHLIQYEIPTWVCCIGLTIQLKTTILNWVERPSMVLQWGLPRVTFAVMVQH